MADALRVAIATESFLPTVNGVTTSVLRVLDHLRERGHDAMVIAPNAGAPSHYRGFPVLEVPALPYRRFPVGLPSVAVRSVLERFGPDVLHAASPFALGASAISAASRLGIPSVAIYQTDVAGYARRNGLAATSPLAWRILRAIHERADLTLAPSTAAIADLDVAWLGERGGEELAAAYAALDVFVHTGSEETFGQTLQEAGASGLPVVAPRAGGPIDIVEEGVTGLLYDPASAAQLRGAVAALVSDAGLRARMGEAARRRMLGRSWTAIGDELLGHYRAAIGARAAVAPA
ncbi:glycosyltransferase [Galbitalea sp. SE-J8]|uniref:glycosyltransferase n=1 Tax=Galbitalea sp. SE-J8 TaxID=3054952 RepID=UPI00259D1C52|nr:glycosyltransferase [Galbitalea sp. SE-J8]MDM4762764.1 glycosyltransferase [Galbitalea sp. SE-J8]